jgi:hypothetical protein
MFLSVNSQDLAIAQQQAVSDWFDEEIIGFESVEG